MVVVGGLAGPSDVDVDASPVRDGAAWVRSSDSWHRISDLPPSIPTITTWGSRTAVWTGSEVLVWASQPAPSRPTSSLGNGSEVVAAYNPTSDHWRSLPASGLTPRQGAVIVWTGSELVVWGGHGLDYSHVFADGARLDPATGTWRRLPSAPVPARGEAASVWDGHEVLLWGGRTGYTTEVGQGAAYSPSTDQWRALPLSPLRAKSEPAGVWTGRLFLVVGGVGGGTFPVPGPGAAAYDPASNSWAALPAAPAFPKVPYGPTWSADQRAGAVAAWTGSSALFVGGLDYQRQGPRPDGLMWSPAT
jgi:hypothetical protein